MASLNQSRGPCLSKARPLRIKKRKEWGHFNAKLHKDMCIAAFKENGLGLKLFYTLYNFRPKCNRFIGCVITHQVSGKFTVHTTLN